MEQAQQRTYTRLPPHNLDAEKSLLGAILLEGDAMNDVVTIVESDDFYATAHQKIYDACAHLFNLGKRVDAVLVQEELSRRGELEAVGGERCLAQLIGLVPSAAGASDYARIVGEKALSRNLIHVCTNIQASAYDGAVAGADLLDSAESQIFALNRGAAEHDTVPIRSVLNDAFDEIQKFIDGEGGLNGVATPFYRFNDMTAGLGYGDLVIVAGRPSMGKTTWCNCVVNHVGMVERLPVLYFSLEVSRTHLVRNMLCSHAKIEMQKVRRGELSQDEIDKLTHAAAELMEAPIFIDDTTNSTPMQIRAKARRVKQRMGSLGLVVVDYIQLMDTPKSENRQLEIAALSRSLKATARELEVPVIAIAQLNRSVDSREDRVPRMSDLRESGALEQDADLICFMYREYMYKPTEENQHKAEVIIAKQRNGPTGRVPLHFFGEYMRFENPSYAEDAGF